MPGFHPSDSFVRRAATSHMEPAVAAAELKAALGDGLSMVVIFLSPELAVPAMARAISDIFAPVPVVGCTSAGEITPAGYQRGSVAAVGFATPDFRVSARLIPDVRKFRVADGPDLVHGALRELAAGAPSFLPGEIFGMLLIDGLDACEESVVSALHPELGAVPLFGGSAGDDLSFRQTTILWEGRFLAHAAILLLVGTSHPFHVFKTEHFSASGEKMVVTDADPVRRIVREINAEPAAQEYARVAGLTTEDLSPMAFANTTVVVRVGHLPYVRSIQKVNDDGSLTFYCAIDQGIVLTVAKARDMVEDLSRLFLDLREKVGELDVVIGCDCILRRFESRQHGMEDRVSAIMAANRVIGFNTYGEQYLAMHVNQTFTGVAIGRRRGEA